ncbi:MAG: DUF2855 family protein [Burkholderiales bacterium]|nr:DUF2855 family protein [Burkholderiales bacterium]
MTTDAGHRLVIARAQLSRAHLGPDPDAPAARALQAGQARLAIDRFALTANNITYAAFGEAMKYWQFFPSGEAATGCLPVWGFAEVVESLAPGLDVGRRVWGYFPAGTHLVVRPSKVSATGFIDGAAHRQELALVYNQYAFCDADPDWKPETEGLQAVLRPLFTTSFLIDDFLADNHVFGAQQVLLSSASSKTALGTAFCLARRRGMPGAPRIIGLTSAANADTTRSLGCYDQVLLYEALPTLSDHVPTVYVDFCGDAELRRRIHTHFGERLRFSSSIGGTHWEALGPARDLPGPRPTLFFAPAQIKLRSAPPPAGWGGAELQRRIAAAWAAFIHQVEAGGWVRIVEQRGAQAALEAYGQMLAGRASAGVGLMLGMRG